MAADSASLHPTIQSSAAAVRVRISRPAHPCIRTRPAAPHHGSMTPIRAFGVSRRQSATALVRRRGAAGPVVASPDRADHYRGCFEVWRPDADRLRPRHPRRLALWREQRHGDGQTATCEDLTAILFSGQIRRSGPTPNIWRNSANPAFQRRQRDCNENRLP